MPSLFTRTGDDGTTGQLGEERLPKSHPRMETLGTLDEASASLGLARALCQAEEIGPILVDVQRDLYALMVEIATEPEKTGRFQSPRHAQGGTLDLTRVNWLESQAEAICAIAPLPNEFILPGDTPGSAALALARTVVRRAERRVASLLKSGDVENQILLQYLNRLSSLVFALELLENQHAGKQTTLAKKEK